MVGPPTARFDLIDHHGQRVTERSFPDRFLLVFFGFTNCRVICPRALTTLTEALDRLGPDAEHYQPLYITVDPDRDDPAQMRSFLEDRYPRFVGLTGSTNEIEEAKSACRVYSQRVDRSDDPAGYVIPHTAMAYVFGVTGELVAHWDAGAEVDEVVSALRSSIR